MRNGLSRGRKWVLGAGATIIVLIVVLSWVGRRRDFRTVASTNAALDSAGLSNGTSVKRVLAVLDSIGAEHSELDSDRQVGARIGRSFESFFIHGDIHADFQFDTTGVLVSRVVREVLTGP